MSQARIREDSVWLHRSRERTNTACPSTRNSARPLSSGWPTWSG